MVTIDDFSRVVSTIYASSTDPANWAVAMADISRALGATGSGLVIGASGGRSVALGSSMPAEAITTYEQYYHSLDFVLHACEVSPAGLIRGGRELLAERTNSEFYADWQSPFDLTDGLFVQLSAAPKSHSLAISAPERSEPFDTAERVGFVSALIPHLRQALRTQEHLAELGEAAAGAAEAIDSLRHGVVVLAGTRVVVHFNAMARRIFNADDGLRVCADGVHATRRSTDEKLQNAVTAALVTQPNGARSGDSLLCSRPSGKRPYVIHVVPLAPPADEPSATRALLLIVDPERGREPPTAVIRQLFGLTKAEADVAMRIVNGDALDTIAADLVLSRATVKTHLQRVFDKTDTHRQAELVRLLMAIVP
ncbi:DNA-binding protein with HTH domain [Mycolicibacterium chubuense NBB4]|uniref:DNA-binding protein with HTH domain n=1 Tax=Mycolicibacterium chubuense (strain NBB4) TaxID=710421 RepID=I4BEG6_MYCCN|nr:helix-turn-helix transcriptional regulator [Mycolicibacterium chubuense]AFM15673.1 DNA-binding protein with HTH domain [Mycolicibacterium chubuense NBB4]